MPGKSSNIRSPFKFLDPYSREDGAIFFGRREEVETLYQYVNKNRLVVVYGQSGTGKTSVVQCGLANRFEITEWKPFFIRRGHNINHSLYHTLSQSQAMEGQEVNANNLLTVLEDINDYYLRRVYLIFDQFEELLILGKPEEQQTFMGSIQRIMEPGQKHACSLLFILREEYFAWLDPFEKKVPGFSNRRLRIEPMRPGRLEKVIIRSCEAFNVSLEEPQKNAGQIIDNLHGKGGVSLPYLQVYLDRLWRENFAWAYPEGTEDEREKALHPALTFTSREIAELGPIQDVLAYFVEERTQAIQQEMEKKYPETPAGTVRQILDAFVTEEGTKRPFSYRLDGEEVTIIEESSKRYFPDLAPAVQKFCLEKLQQSRLLRMEEDVIELAHDSLAVIIDQQRSEEQRYLNALKRRLDNLFQEYKNSETLLNRKQVRLFEDYLEQLSPDESKMAFIEKSRKAIEAEEEKLARQAEEERKLRKKAENSRKIAEDALDKLNAFFFGQVDGLILRLEHATALDKLMELEAELKSYYEVIDIDSTISRLLPRLLELAYFRNEALQPEEALKVVSLIGEIIQEQLLPESFSASAPGAYSELKKAIQEKCEDGLWEKLEARYYPEMIFIDGGSFNMGDDNDPGASPIHRVALDDFYLARTPTTFWQFGLFCESTGRNIYNYAPPWGLEGNNPAVFINWFEAMNYANWLNKRRGHTAFLEAREDDSYIGKPNMGADGYRLPTEAEWEFAARGGHHRTPGRFSGGDQLRKVGWYNEKRTRPVAAKDPNQLGLHDMSGNVWEWCMDLFSETFYKRSSREVVENPVCLSSSWAASSTRAVRGGAWNSSQFKSCMVTFRANQRPESKGPQADQGFRLAKPAG